MSLLGKKAPDFVAQAIMGDNSLNEEFNFYDYIKDHVTVLFFWPADFTFVCPTEVIAFNNRLKSFEERAVKIVGCSVDSHHSHLSWKQAPLEKGGVGQIQYPMVSDATKKISENYSILSEEGIAYRATFLIDQEGIIVHQVVNNFRMGRNIDETSRMVDALLYTQRNNLVCPANWEKDQKGIKETEEDIGSYLVEHAPDL
jgi:peroxiredoxin (alkyl hydroperoxide reductase subunit C)